jgi:DNA-binding PadR family transcriptional regulator
VLHVLGPCTAYLVRQEFLDSPSPYWSGSAGAIYPLIDRLRRRGLVQASVRAVGRRHSRHLVLTRPGRAQLRAWLRPPLPEVVIGVPSDPLRTRIGFLDALPPRARRRALEDAARRMAIHRRAIDRDVERCRRKDDPYELMAALGAQAALGARQAWLRTVVRTLAAARGRRR